MPRKLKVAVTFVMDTSQSPNLRTADLGDRFEVYWQCITVALASARILGGDVEPVLFFNQDIPPRFRKLFDLYGIGHIKTDFSFCPPPGFADKFIGSLYMLDAIKWFAENAADDEKLLIIDPDCFVSGSLAPVAAFLDSVEACVYPLRFPHDYDGNGQSLNGMDQWMARHLPDLERGGLRWIGGELLGLTGAGSRVLMPLIERIWQANLQAFAAGAPRLRTEEHVLSVALAGARPTRRDVGGEIVRRLWTARSYYNLTGLSRELPVWHMPAEKQRGFATLFDRLQGCADPDAARRVLSDRAMLARAFGFEGRIVTKLICELWMSLKRLGALARGRAPEFEGHS